MTRSLAPLAAVLALALAAVGGCSRETSSAPRPGAPPAASPTTAPTAPAAPTAPTGAPAATALTPSAANALDAMDKRTAVPLLPMMAHHQKQNMRDHLLAVQEIVAALATDDYAAIEKAAARIGFSEKEAAACNHMGAGAPAFIEQALAFHRTADGIGAAARAKDRTRVLTELGVTLKTCTACHETWKQQVVDVATWQRVTGTAPPMMMHGMAH